MRRPERRSERLLPGVARLRGYDRTWLRPDVVAGVTVAAYLVPQVMAYAEVARLPPVTGLWAAVAALVVYAVLGSSPQLSVGPESTTALMTATAVVPLAAGDPSRRPALAAGLALCVGGVCLLAWLARLGFLADLLSRPVLVGYLGGVALIMIISQLGTVTGLRLTGTTAVAELRSFLGRLGEINAVTLALASGVLAFLLIVSHRFPHAPVPLLGVLAAAAVTTLLDLGADGVALVGPVPAGLPTPRLPAVDAADLRALAVAALGVTVVGYTDNVLTARAFAHRGDYRVDGEQELLALGAANVGAGLVGGFPVSSSGSRTVIGDAMGSCSQLYSLVAVTVVLLTLLLGRGLLAAFPRAALGALVIYAALRLVEVAEFRRLARFRRSELVLAVATTIGVLLVDILYGVLVAVALSILDLLRRVARPHDGVLGYVPGVAGMHDIDDYPGARQVPGLVVYRYDSPLFFANAENFSRRALQAVDEGVGPTHWFVLNMEANVQVDLTSVDALSELHRQLVQRDVVLALARVKRELGEDLERAGLIAEVAADRVFPTLPTAVAAYGRWYTERFGKPPPGFPPDPDGSSASPPGGHPDVSGS